MGWTLGVIISVALIFITLITAFEIATYADYGFYQSEYEKYQVLDDVGMEMEDVMYVTREMMAYLRGNRENLEVNTVVEGESREFFNDREKHHMADVQLLFLAGMALRNAAIIIAVCCFIVLLVNKCNWKKLIPKSFQIVTIAFAVLTGGLVFLFSTDFTKYFTKFHEIFFSNDLWLLDPSTDLLINILPEGFFIDMAVRICIIFAGILFVLLGGSFFATWFQKNKNHLK